MSSVNTTALELTYYCDMFRLRSHRQADYIRTVNTLYPLQYHTCDFYIRDPICITIV